MSLDETGKVSVAVIMTGALEKMGKTELGLAIELEDVGSGKISVDSSAKKTFITVVEEFSTSGVAVMRKGLSSSGSGVTLGESNIATVLDSIISSDGVEMSSVAPLKPSAALTGHPRTIATTVIHST